MNKRSTRFNLIITALVFPIIASACSLTEVCPTAEPCPTSVPCPTPSPRPSIVGSWEGDAGGTSINFTFEASGSFIMYMEGVEVARGQYALLETIVPTGIDLIYSDDRVIYAIFEFITPDSMRLENVLVGDPRPIAFNDSNTFRRTNP